MVGGCAAVESEMFCSGFAQDPLMSSVSPALQVLLRALCIYHNDELQLQPLFFRLPLDFSGYLFQSDESKVFYFVS